MYTVVDFVRYPTDICNRQRVVFILLKSLSWIFVYFLLCLNNFVFLDLLKMSFNNSHTRSQGKQIVYSFYTFLKQLSPKPDLTADFLKNAQIRTAEAVKLVDCQTYML